MSSVNSTEDVMAPIAASTVGISEPQIAEEMSHDHSMPFRGLSKIPKQREQLSKRVGLGLSYFNHQRFRNPATYSFLSYFLNQFSQSVAYIVIFAWPLSTRNVLVLVQLFTLLLSWSTWWQNSSSYLET